MQGDRARGRGWGDHGLSGAHRHAWQRYAAAVLIVTAAVGVRAGLLGALGTRAVYVTFYPAVIVAALYGGLPAGLLATVLSTGAATWWMNPVGRLFVIRDPLDWLGLAVFIVSCTMISAICEAMHRAQARATKAEAEAKVADARRQAEAALNASEGRYRSLFENMLNGFAYCRMMYNQDRPQDFIYLTVNSAFETLTGLKNVTGKKVSEVIPGIRESDPELFELYGRVALTGMPERFETFVKALGEWFAISVYSPKRECFVAVFDVITERKLAVEALMESAGRLKMALSASNMGVWEWNIQTDAVFWSPECYEIAGVESPKVTFESFTESLHPEDAARVMTAIDQAMASRSVYTAEFRIIRPDGKVIWISNLGKADYDETGKPLRMVGIVRDITDRKQAEHSLREGEERYRVLVENAAEMIAVTQDGILKFANPEAEVISGYSRDELTTRPFLEFVHAEDRARAEANYQHLLKGEPILDGGEIRIVRKDGAVRWLNIKGTRILWKGAPATLNFYTDATEHLRAEEEREKLKAQLFQAQKMESVGRLAGGVAHDFNNMLCVIIGNAESALERVDPADPLHGDLQEIQKAGQRSADLTRQLLAFARRQTVSPKVLDLNDTIEGMLKMLRRLIGEDTRLAWSPSHDLWNVRMDPSQIDQILANLAVNARDAISGVGQVAVETANVVFDDSYCAHHVGSVPGEYAMLALTDNGTGMSKDVLEHIFEPFFTTKEVGKGTGLGLATVYGIVKQNNGFIDVLSEPGKGTTFKIYLPRFGTNTAQALPETESKKTPGGKETILLVEDAQPLLELGRRILETLGYTVLVASTPQEAIDHAGKSAGDIHLLITDVVMPEMNGRELMEKLCAARPAMKCLFMSGYTTDIIARQGILEEGIHFIQKPFTRDSFAAKIREALEGI